MSGYIPEDKIAEIRTAADIVDIVSEAVILKKSGKNYLGLCPFHQEKTPSFTVSPDKQIFHCFGCNEGGNVFSFLMKHQGITFPEAVRALARRYGIDLPREEMSPEQEKAESHRQRLLSANAAAAAFFQQCLTGGRQGEAARTYVGGRGLTGEILEMFKIGYAPDGWDHLVNHLERKQVPLDVAEQAGLVVKKQNGGYYDRFRNRIIFPITDVSGRIVAFGGRVMDESLPKYLNSPETPLYNKRRVLYGLAEARQKCRETGVVYITEGYMDFLAVYRHGIENVVATLGTAMTVEHLRLLKGYVTKAVMVFDADEAGIKAARRGIDLFSQEKGIKPFVLSLPQGHDPDSFLRQHGAERFQQVAAKAKDAVVYLMDEAVARFGLSVDGKLRAMADMEPVLAAIDDELARSLYVKELAERLGIEERAVRERVTKAVALLKSGDQGKIPPVLNDDLPRDENPADFCSGKFRLERQIIEMMLHAPGALAEAEQTAALACFENQSLASLGRIILAHRQTLIEGRDDMLALVENEDQKRLITALLVGDELSPVSWEATECRKLMQQFMARCACGKSQVDARLRDADNNDNLLKELLKSKRRQLKQIKNNVQLIE